MTTKKQVVLAATKVGAQVDIVPDVMVSAWLPESTSRVWAANGSKVVCVGHNAGMALADCYSELLELIKCGIN